MARGDAAPVAVLVAGADLAGILPTGTVGGHGNHGVGAGEADGAVGAATGPALGVALGDAAVERRGGALDGAGERSALVGAHGNHDDEQRRGEDRTDCGRCHPWELATPLA
jgi:hypothetical protein